MKKAKQWAAEFKKKEITEADVIKIQNNAIDGLLEEIEVVKDQSACAACNRFLNEIYKKFSELKQT